MYIGHSLGEPGPLAGYEQYQQHAGGAGCCADPWHRVRVGPVPAQCPHVHLPPRIHRQRLRLSGVRGGGEWGEVPDMVAGGRGEPDRIRFGHRSSDTQVVSILRT